MKAKNETLRLGYKTEQLLRTLYPWGTGCCFRHPVRVALFHFVALCSFHVVLTRHYGVFSGNPQVRNFVEDWTYVPTTLTLTVIVYYYFSLPKKLGRALQNLVENGVFPSNRVAVQCKYFLGLHRRFGQGIPFLFATLMVIGGVLLWPQQASWTEEKVWFQINNEALLLVMISWWISWFALIGLLVNIFVAWLFIKNIFRYNKIAVYALHPDGGGGLGPLGMYSVHLSYLGLLVGLTLIVYTAHSITRKKIEHDYALMGTISVYFLIVPSLFYMHLWTVHKAMKDFRDRLLVVTATHYLNQSLKLYRTLNAISTDSMRQALAELNELKSLREHQRAYPTWPFPIISHWGIIFRSALPIFFTVLELLIEILK